MSVRLVRLVLDIEVFLVQLACSGGRCCVRICPTPPEATQSGVGGDMRRPDFFGVYAACWNGGLVLVLYVLPPERQLKEVPSP